MSRNVIYEKLTAIPDDPVGVFAYIVYKQQKIEFLKSFGGREPTREELDGFHAVACLDVSIEAYRARGEVLAQLFLNACTEGFLRDIEASMRRDVLFQQAESVKSKLLEKLTAIGNILSAKRTFVGWIREVGGNLVVNLVTILVLGALLLGYNFSVELQQGTERRVSIERK